MNCDKRWWVVLLASAAFVIKNPMFIETQRHASWARPPFSWFRISQFIYTARTERYHTGVLNASPRKKGGGPLCCTSRRGVDVRLIERSGGKTPCSDKDQLKTSGPVFSIIWRNHLPLFYATKQLYISAHFVEMAISVPMRSKITASRHTASKPSQPIHLPPKCTLRHRHIREDQ